MVNIYEMFWRAMRFRVAVPACIAAILIDGSIEYANSTYGEAGVQFHGRTIGTQQIRFVVVQAIDALNGRR